MDRLLIVPAGGLGTRLGGTTPKLLVEVNGRPMIEHLRALYAGIAGRLVVVVHPTAAALVRQRLGTTADVFVQPRPTGMLDAVMQARPAVETHRPRRVLITWCDQIAIHPATVASLREAAAPPDAPSLVFPTCRQAPPYIHCERDAAGRIVRILHRREGDAMPPVGESDTGLFDLSLAAYLDWLPAYATEARPGGGTGELNFLPFIPWVASRAPVVTFPCVEAEEAIGVNTPADLAAVSAYLRNRAR